MFYHLKSFSKIMVFILSALTGAIFLVLLISPWIYRGFNRFAKLHLAVGLTASQLDSNYQSIINFLLNPTIKQLHLIDFSSSSAGLQHFVEVKFLIQLTVTCFIFLMILSLFLLSKQKSARRKDPYLRLYFKFGQLLPLGLMFVAVVAFDKVFLIFHQLFFRNDLWLFDPIKDPVINVLPESFFFVLLIFVVLVYEILLGLMFLSIKNKLR